MYEGSILPTSYRNFIFPAKSRGGGGNSNSELVTPKKRSKSATDDEGKYPEWFCTHPFPKFFITRAALLREFFLPHIHDEIEKNK